MIFGIVILLMLLAIAFFHYVQGFFSATISAVIAVICAVIAVSYYESLVEGPLSGVAPEWMPTLILLALFALPYVILRTLFDKMVPGQITLPPIVDKIGGAVMGIVAGVFGLGVVVIAAQYMPFGPSIGGYVRYETTDSRGAAVPGQANSSGASGRSKDAATYHEIVGDHFDPEKSKSLLIPVDDAVVKTVAHVSKDGGSLSNGKPFASVHPDLLQELFGSRLGIQQGGGRVAINNPARADIEVTGVFEAPPITDAQIVDHEFKRIRGTPLKLTAKVPQDEMRVIVRVKFNPTAADTKDRKVRLSPGGVRLATMRPDDVYQELEPHNYYPIGTMDPNGVRMYAHKIDDFLFVETPAKKVDGSGDAPGEVDFVFQVKRDGFIEASGGGANDKGVPKVSPGTFIEVKRFGRVPLDSGEASSVKLSVKPLPTLAIKRKNLQNDGGPAPMQPAKGGAATPGAPPAAPAAPSAGAGGGALGQRLVGEWKTGTAVTGEETITFAADGNANSSKAGALRWVAAGPAQGETLTIKTAAGGADPNAGETRTIVFEDENQFSMTDSTGNRRFSRVGSPAAAGAAPAPVGPDAAMSKMVGTWESEAGLTYTFRPDGTYTATQAASGDTPARSGSGTWRVTGLRDRNDVAQIELINKSGKATPQEWNIGAAHTNQIYRITDGGALTTFVRKS